MNIRGLFFLTLATVLIWGGCKGPEGPEPERSATLDLGFSPQSSGLAFFPEEVYENHDGQRFMLERFRFLISDLRLVDKDGVEDTLVDYALVDFTSSSLRTPDTLINGATNMELEIVPGTYETLKFNIGVPAERNNGNPAEFPEDHPLSIRQGLHWTWSSGYIFLQIDGRLDTTINDEGELEQAFIYHAGTNDLIRPMEFSLNDLVLDEDGMAEYRLEVDVNRTFFNDTEGIDMKVDNLTHSTPVGSDAFNLAERVMNNFANGAWSLERQ